MDDLCNPAEVVMKIHVKPKVLYLEEFVVGSKIPKSADGGWAIECDPL